MGRSRGGCTSKIHARADGQGRPLGFLLTAGEVADHKGVEPMMALLLAKPRFLLADKGYDGDAVRQDLLPHGILPVIPPRSSRTEPPPCDHRCYKDRNRIERMFNRLKQCRRLATRHDNTASSFLGCLNLAAATIRLPALVDSD